MSELGSRDDPRDQDLPALLKPLGSSTYVLELEDHHFTLFLPPTYPFDSPPQIYLDGQPKDSPLDQELLDETLLHLWESSERSPVLGDLVEWLEGLLSSKPDGKDDESETKEDWSPDPARPLVIYTWGDQMKGTKPTKEESENNFNAKCLNCRGGGVDLKSMNGTWPELQTRLKASSSFHTFRRGFIRAVESKNLTRVSVNCSKGRHRCASFAEVMREDYPLLVVHHKSLKLTTSPKDLHLRTKNKKSRK